MFRGKRVCILGPEWRNAYIVKNLVSRGYSVLRFDNHEDIDPNKYDVLISSGYDRKIPSQIIYKEHILAVNAHSSFLPFGRGIGTQLFGLVFPVSLGCCVHVLESEFDSGDILVRRKFDISEIGCMTQREYYNYSVRETSRLLLDHWDQLLAGSVERITNDCSESVPYFTRSDSEMLWALLPNGWDTPIADCISMSESISGNFAFLSLLDVGSE